MTTPDLVTVELLVSGIVHAPIEKAWDVVARFTNLQEWVLPNPDGSRVWSRLLVSACSARHWGSQTPRCSEKTSRAVLTSSNSENMCYDRLELHCGLLQPGGRQEYCIGCIRAINIGEACYLEELTALDNLSHLL